MTLSSNGKKTVLLVSNVKLHEANGRAEKFETRKRLLQNYGWEVIVGYVPKPLGINPLPRFRDIVKCYRLAIENDVDVIDSVSEPPQLHGVGYLISRLTQKPWLAEFRDPLAHNPNLNDDTTKAKIRAKIEKFTVKNADLVVWDNGIQIPEGYFESTYPEIPPDRVHRLPYLGFSQKKFENSSKREFDKFTITYAGSFYEGWIEPYTFLKSLESFLDEKSPSNIQILFYGDWSTDYEKYTQKLGIEEYITTKGWVQHSKLVPVLKGSDVLLHIGGELEDNRLNVPSKIFDYIGARQPILCIAGEDFRVYDLVEKKNLGIAVPEDSKKICSALEQLYSGKVDVGNARLDGFSRQNRIKELANVLDEVHRSTNASTR